MDKRKRWIEDETGEVIEVARGQNFVKMYKKSMVKMLKVVGGKKVEVIIYILKNLRLSDNTLVKTQREIARDCNVSVKTVNETLKGLSEQGLLKKKAGSYMLTPDLFYRGDERKKNYMLSEFNSFGNQGDN